MKTVKIIVNIIVVILLLPIFASVTTGVAVMDILKGQTFSLNFVEKTVLTTINIAKALLDLTVKLAHSMISLILLGVTFAELLVKKLFKLVKKPFAKLISLAKVLLNSVKGKINNAKEKVSTFGLATSTLFLSNLLTLPNEEEKDSVEAIEEVTTESTQAENVSIKLELELTDELIQLLNLDSETPSLTASLSISPEIAVNIFKALSGSKLVMN